MNETASAYIPGVCNINREEIAKRRKLGHIGAGMFVMLLVLLIILGVNRYARLVLLLPAFLAASGYLQARNHFCVGYAAAGQQNAAEHSNEATKINDQSDRLTDKRRARMMNLQTFGLTVVVTGIGIALPSL